MGTEEPSECLENGMETRQGASQEEMILACCKNGDFSRASSELKKLEKHYPSYENFVLSLIENQKLDWAMFFVSDFCGCIGDELLKRLTEEMLLQSALDYGLQLLQRMEKDGTTTSDSYLALHDFVQKCGESTIQQESVENGKTEDSCDEMIEKSAPSLLEGDVLSEDCTKTPEELSVVSCHRDKMKLFGVFVILNVLFVLVVQCAPSIVVHALFLGYIIFSALPRFLFGSILHFCKPRGRAATQNETNDLEEKLKPKWTIAADPIFCKCGADCTSKNYCPFCGKSVQEEHPALLSACISVHHESEDGLEGGLTSFERANLPFEPKFCQLVFIIDGRYDRNGNVDALQLRSAQYLLSRLYGVEMSSICVGDDAVLALDENKEDKCEHDHPQILHDGTAIYRGTFKRGMPFVVVLKRFNFGKRHSHQLFFEYMNCCLTQRTAGTIMYVDSDVLFSWKGNDDNLKKLYESLNNSPSAGGACGEIEVRHWYKNPLTMCQYFEYKSNQFLAKTAENWFGMVTCLPGAFCMVKAKAQEDILNGYLAKAESIFEKNRLDLGEDRTLTTLLLSRGWETEYVKSAKAPTDVPSRLIGLVRQRRRWINSTLVNMAVLLRNIRRLSALPLLLSLVIELVSSLILPSAVLMLLFQVGMEMGIYPAIVAAVLILWCTILIVVSLTMKIEKLEYWFQASALLGAAIMIVMIFFIVQHFDVFFDKYWTEAAVLVSWVCMITFSALIHGQWFSVVCVLAPVMWLLMTPVMYIVAPIYSVCNFDDVSWGTRMT